MKRFELLLLALLLAGCSLNHRLDPPPPPPPPPPLELEGNEGVVEADPEAEIDVARLEPGDGQRPHYQAKAGDLLLDVLQDETVEHERILVVYLEGELSKAELERVTRALRSTAKYRYLRMFVSYYLPGEIGREPWASAAFTPELTLAIGEEIGVAPARGGRVVWRRIDPDEEEEAVVAAPSSGYRSSSPRARPALNMSRPVPVRSYYRKDGTYVRAHTRRRPRR